MTTHRELSCEQVEAALRELPDGWGPAFLSPAAVSSIGIGGENNLEIAASGVLCESSSVQMYGMDVIAGFTVLREEPNPNREKGEGDVNADHYVLAGSDDRYLLYGPYKTQKTMAANAGIPHWPSEQEFFAFVDNIHEQQE